MELTSDVDRDFETFDEYFNTNLRPNSKRKSRLFAATIAYVDNNKLKQDIFNQIEPYCSMLLVSEEPHFNRMPHHHIFLRTIEQYYLVDIRNLVHFAYERDIIEAIDLNDHEYVNNGILIQTIRNQDNYLKYITKFDTNPIFAGINENRLSFYYNSIKWAQNTSKFDYTDPHVLNHPQYYKLLEKVHTRIQAQKKQTKIVPLRPFLDEIDEEKQRSWQGIVIQWWNDWIINGYEHKKKQLYLWGKSNAGKTTFILNLIKACMKPLETEDNRRNEIQEDVDYDLDEYCEQQIMRPTPKDKRFAWQDFDTNLHRIVIIDEFDFGDYDVTDLKKALAGETLVANRKSETAIKIRLRMPIIFISNCEPPKNDGLTQIQGFNERILVVKADRMIR